jgi:hypothetical protein
MDLPLPQTDLGRLAGISRESTCKALRRLKQQGVLDYSRRGDLTILRPDILAAIRSEGTRLTVAPGGLDLGDPLRWPPASERARKKASPGHSRFQSEIPNT